jgi:hypothetical protein
MYFPDLKIVFLLYCVSTLQDKPLPYFGKSEQVGFTFFSYHLPITIFGIVDASREKNYCYLTDKLQSGSKSGNVTLNYIIRYKHTNKINSFFM